MMSGVMGGAMLEEASCEGGGAPIETSKNNKNENNNNNNNNNNKKNSKRKKKTDIYGSLLRFCGASRALSRGALLHAHLLRHGLLYNPKSAYLANLLLQMYGICGAPLAARSVFDRIPSRDVFSWNLMIAAYVRNGRPREALDAFWRMLLPLSSSLSSMSLPSMLSSPSLPSSMLPSASLLLLTPSPSSLPLSPLSSSMPPSSLSSLLPLSPSLSPSSLLPPSSELPSSMSSSPFLPLSSLLPPPTPLLMSVSSSLPSLSLLPSPSFPSSSLLLSSMLSPLSLLPPSSLPSWSLPSSSVPLLSLPSSSPPPTSSLPSSPPPPPFLSLPLLLSPSPSLVCSIVKPDKCTFLAALAAAAALGALTEGKHIHHCIIAAGLSSDLALQTALLNMYGKSGAVEEAFSLFHSARERNVFSWTAMISAFARNGRGTEALALFRRMHHSGVHPNRITLLAALDACTRMSSLESGQAIHEYILANGFESDVIVNNALLNMYGKCGSLKDAQTVFHKMQDWNLISWNAMITAYTQHGHGEEALELFQQMQSEGIRPDQVTYLCLLNACANLPALEEGKAIHRSIIANQLGSDYALNTALLHMYGRCGSLGEAKLIFDGMPHEDAIPWNAMIGAYVQNGHSEEALKLFSRMGSNGVNPDKITFLCLLSACSNLASLEIGREIHKCAFENGFESDIPIANALLNFYGKCGSLEEAREVFDGMQKWNLISWNAMFAAYAQNGHGKEVLDLFCYMNLKGRKPDRITFLCLLNAFSHAGLPEEAWQYLTYMRADHSFTPLQEHYMCIVDLLGRAGQLKEVADMLKNMPLQIDNVACTALLGPHYHYHKSSSHKDYSEGVMINLGELMNPYGALKADQQTRAFF